MNSSLVPQRLAANQQVCSNERVGVSSIFVTICEVLIDNSKDNLHCESDVMH